VKLLSKLKPHATNLLTGILKSQWSSCVLLFLKARRVLFLNIGWIKHVHLASLTMSSISAPTLNYLCELPCSVAFVQKIVYISICELPCSVAFVQKIAYISIPTPERLIT
jgi:hypothetical protein